MLSSALGISLLLSLASMVAGLVIAWRAESRLKDGLRLERWSEREVEELRKKANLPIWSWVYWGLVIVYFAALVLAPRHSPFIFFGYPMLILVQMIVRLRVALRPATPPTSRLAWSDLKPIHSDHWGGRSAG